jgi:hypothetical protein
VIRRNVQRGLMARLWAVQVEACDEWGDVGWPWQATFLGLLHLACALLWMRCRHDSFLIGIDSQRSYMVGNARGAGTPRAFVLLI